MAEVKKFLDFTGLSRYHTNIKGYIDGNVGNISNLTTTAKSNVVVALNEVNALAKGAAKALVVNSYSALISTLSSASKGDYLIGQHFYVKTLDVPDVWISGINNNSTTYTYVSDSKVEEDLESNNLVVGYFQLSPLEGQKIDLSDYATTSDLSDLDDRKLDKDVEIVISAAINDLESRKLDKDTLTFLINITYSDLKNLRDNDQLVKGQQYRITDFVTTTTQENTQSAGHAFDIIVVADDVNVLNENARAIKHPGDTYFADSKLEAWELKYCLDNDTTRFAWADATNGKGVIYYMKDEFENECPYDFKNIQFPRYKITACAKSPDLVGQYSVDGLSDITVDTETTYWCYTFSMIDFNNDNLAHDVSVEQDKYLGDEGFCYKQQNNIIKEYYDTFYGDDTKINYLFLPDNVFVTDTSYGEFYGFYSNLLGNNNSHNTFGNNCRYNTFGNYCNYNTFGNSCNNNSFGNGCNHITFAKDYMYYNIVENGNQYITVSSTATTSSSSVIRNFTIAQGVNNSTTLKTISHDTTNDTFKTIYQNSNSTIVNV